MQFSYSFLHRALLAHASGKLADLLDKKEPIKLPEKEFPNFTSEAFHSLLKFIYFFDTHIKPLPACQLIHFAKDFQIPHLGYASFRSNISKIELLFGFSLVSRVVDKANVFVL